MNSQNQTEYESFSLMDVDTQYLKIKKFQDSNEQINLSDQSIQKIAQNGQWNECLSDLEIELQAILSGRVINMDHLLQYLNKRLQPFIIFILNKIIYDHKRLKLQCYLNEILFLVQKLAFRIIKQFPIQSLELLKQIHSKIEFYNSRICEFQVYQSGINQFYNQRLNHRLQNQAESYIDNQQLICYYPLKNEIIDQQYQAKGVLIFSPFQRMQIHYFYKNGGFEILSDLITNFTLKNLNTIFILQYFQKLMDRVTYQNQFENFNIQQIIQKLSDDDIKNSNKDAINQLISMPNLFPCKNMTFIEKQANAAYFELNIYLLCLRCSSLQKRIYGLQQFCDKIQTSFSQVQQSFQNNELLLKFLTENQVFQDLFGEKTHIELIKRSFPIVKFLYLNKTIKGEDLVTILRLAKAKHETWMHSISTILQDLAEILSLEDLQIMLLYIKSDTIGLDGLNFIRSLGRNEYLENYPNRQSSELIESKFKKQKLNTQYDYRLIEIGDCNEDEKKSNNSQQKIQQNSQSEKPELLQIKKEIVEYLFKVINESPNSMIGEKAFEIAIELICHQFPSLRIQYLTFAIETLDSNNAQLPIYYYFNLIQQIIQSSYPIENFKDSMEVLFWMQKFNFKNNFLQLIMREKLNSLEKDVTEYLQIITQCVQFYKFIHQNSKIKTQEIQFLWKLLIENARCLEERDLCFDWFYEQQLLEYDALEWLFMKLIKQCHLSQSMLKCLISLIFHFNARFNILQSHFQQEYQLSDSNFIGLNILWRIFRQQPELYDQLSEFFIKLLKVKQKSDILNQLKQQYLTELFSCIQNPSSINFVIQLLEEFEGLKLMDQEEKMLITIFNQCSNALNPKQQEIKLQSNLKVYQAKQIIGQKLNPWMKPEDFDIFCKDDLFKDYKTLKDYQVSSKLTFLIKNKQDLNNENQVYHQNNQDVDEKIRNIQDIVNIQNRQFILSVLKNKNWNVDNTIGELLDRGDQLYIEYQKTNRNIENQKKVQPSSSFAFLISNQYIDQLFELLNQDNQQIKEKIWSILQVIPSNQNVYQLIEASQNDWNKLLNVDNKYRLQYHLQILKEQLIYNQMEDQDYYSNLRFNFLSQGGLQLLLNNLDNPAEIVLTILDIFQMYLNSYAINELNYNDFLHLLKLKQTNQITSLFLSQNYLQDYEIHQLKNQNQLFTCQILDELVDWSNLLNTLLQKKNIEQFYTMILCILYVRPTLLNQQQIPIDQLLTLLTSPSSEQRKLTAIFILTLNDIGKRFGQNLSKQFLCTFIKGQNVQEELFIVIGELIEQENDVSYLNTRELTMSILKLIQNRPIIEEPFVENEDKLLQGNLFLLKSLLKRDSSLSVDLIEIEFCQYLFKCLFEMNNNYSKYPIYKRSNTRQKAFDILLELSKVQKHLFPILRLIQQNFQSKSISSRQNYEFGIKGSHGYVGLCNLGATCYINSILQQLFMNVQFRKAILNSQLLFKDEKLGIFLVYDVNQIQVEQIQNLNDHTLFQLQLVFIELQESVKQYINPIQFIKTFKGFDGQQIDPLIQGDCNEFFNLLTGTLEVDQKYTIESNLINQSFGGILVNEIKSLESDCDFQKETEEPFLTLSVEVKNKKNLYEALDLFVKSDVLEGENQYFCDEVNRKIDVEKRCYFKKLPKTLIFHLKRFEFDFNTDTRSKLNDYCEFPLEINMFQWTRDNIVERKQLEDFIEYKYILKGVLVHKGSAQGGHYFSYIKDHKNKWYEFNDNLITPFDISNLNEQCFGGNSSNNNWGIQNSQSAYMLFYEKLDIRMSQIEIEDMKQQEQTNNIISQNLNEEYLRTQTIIQNTQYLENKLLNDQDYMKFIQQLLYISLDNNEIQNQDQLLQCFTIFTFQLYYKNKDQQIFQKNLRILSNRYNNNSKICSWLLDFWIKNKEMFIGYLIEQQIIESTQFLNLVIEKVRRQEQYQVENFFSFYLSELFPIVKKNYKKGVIYLEVIRDNLKNDFALLKQILDKGYFNQFYQLLKEKLQFQEFNNYLRATNNNEESLILICEIMSKVIRSCKTVGMQQSDDLLIQNCPTYLQTGSQSLYIDEQWINQLFEKDDFRKYILSMIQYQVQLIQMIKHICWNNKNISSKVMQQIIFQILDKQNQWQQLEFITDVLKEVLNMQDGLQEYRIITIFTLEQQEESATRDTTILKTIQQDDLNYSIGLICMFAQLGSCVVGLSEYFYQCKEEYDYLLDKLRETFYSEQMFNYPRGEMQKAIKQFHSIFKLDQQFIEELSLQQNYQADESRGYSDQAQCNNDDTHSY